MNEDKTELIYREPKRNIFQQVYDLLIDKIVDTNGFTQVFLESKRENNEK